MASPDLSLAQQLQEYDDEDRGQTVPPMSPELKKLFSSPRIHWGEMIGSFAHNVAASTEYGSVLVAGGLMTYITGDPRWTLLGFAWYTPPVREMRESFVRDFLSDLNNG